MANKIAKLRHSSIKLPNSGEIIVLNTGAVLDAETVAMLQALHSRSTGGLRSHLKKVIEKGSAKFMRDTYVGYGHKSIGDCATTTVFMEGFSMLVAKAIQDSQLYNGQESSTRYIQFSEQEFIDPTNTRLGNDLLEIQREFYLNAQKPTIELLRKLHPRLRGEDEEKYDKAISARTFDITRSLLPAGASTNLALHTNLRQAADRILFLRHHPLKEVRDAADGLEKILTKCHPNSFGHKRYEETENYQELVAQGYYFHDSNAPEMPVIDFSGIDLKELEKFRELLDKRPKKTEIPKYVGTSGTMKVSYKLDFGSFRDIQRHRALNQRMPLLTQELGFNPWYVDNFAPEVREELPMHLKVIRNGIRMLGVDEKDAQYFIPMGYNTSNRFVGDIPAVGYMVELRDSRFVHPTLQRVAHDIGNQISNNLRIKLHVDSEPNKFDIKRGEHDIKIK